MSDIIKVRGTVLSASPIGETDKRAVIETCELGKITAFIRGCRRAGSPLQAAANPFVTGEFAIVATSRAYRVADISVREYFRELTSLIPGVYAGFYFLDMVDFYGREGIDGTDMLNLLYMSLKALMNGKIDDDLIRRIFELRLLHINGDYAPDVGRLEKSLLSVCRFITETPINRLYTFDLRPDAFSGLEKECKGALARVVDRNIKSRSIMEAMYGDSKN